MHRREFIALVGGAAGDVAVGRPFSVHAQQSATPVIGCLNGGWPGPFAPFAAPFREGLKDAGYFEGPQCRNRIPLGRGGIPYVACRLTFRSVILR